MAKLDLVGGKLPGLKVVAELQASLEANRV
jgi:hypothetical protein